MTSRIGASAPSGCNFHEENSFAAKRPRIDSTRQEPPTDPLTRLPHEILALIFNKLSTSDDRAQFRILSPVTRAVVANSSLHQKEAILKKFLDKTCPASLEQTAETRKLMSSHQAYIHALKILSTTCPLQSQAVSKEMQEARFNFHVNCIQYLAHHPELLESLTTEDLPKESEHLLLLANQLIRSHRIQHSNLSPFQQDLEYHHIAAALERESLAILCEAMVILPPQCIASLLTRLNDQVGPDSLSRENVFQLARKTLQHPLAVQTLQELQKSLDNSILVILVAEFMLDPTKQPTINASTLHCLNAATLLCSQQLALSSELKKNLNSFIQAQVRKKVNDRDWIQAEAWACCTQDHTVLEEDLLARIDSIEGENFAEKLHRTVLDNDALYKRMSSLLKLSGRWEDLISSKKLLSGSERLMFSIMTKLSHGIEREAAINYFKSRGDDGFASEDDFNAAYVILPINVRNAFDLIDNYFPGPLSFNDRSDFKYYTQIFDIFLDEGQEAMQKYIQEEGQFAPRQELTRIALTSIEYSQQNFRAQEASSEEAGAAE